MQFPPTSATLQTRPNGLSLVLAPDRRVPVVSVQLWVGTGSMHEGALTGSGVSHFLEHMVFKGGGRFSATGLAEGVQAAGGHWNAYTSFDRTVYYIDGPASGLDTFLEVLVAMVFHPHLPGADFDKERDVIRREIDMGLDDPDDVATRQLLSTAFVRDPRTHPVIGHRSRFDDIRHDDLTGYHRDRYTPDRCCLCVGGDLDPARVEERVAALVDGLPRGSGCEPHVPRDPRQLGPRRAHRTFDVPTSRITLAWKMPPLGDPDSPALDLAAAILGRGRSSRLYRELREERELALELSAWSWNQPEREGLFAVSAETGVARRDELIDAVRTEVGNLADTSLGADLEKAKRQIAASQFRSLTTVSGTVGDLASNWHEARDLDFTRHYLARLDAVTPESLRDALRRLDRSTETLAILDPHGTPPPAPPGAGRARRPEPGSFTLANGTTVALLPDPAVPVLALQAAARGGSSAETTASAGLNRLLAATLPQATRRHGAGELAMLLESLGATLSASAGNNSLLVQLNGLAPDLATLAPLFTEVLLQPALDEDSIARERASQLATLRESLEDPLALSFRMLRETLFGPGGYGVPSLGSPDSLESLDRATLADFHHRHVTGCNLSLALAGDFDPGRARDLLEAGLEALAVGEPFLPPASSPRDPAQGLARLPKKQAVLAIGFPGCGALDRERFALRMLQEWCSDMAGPLFMKIREELGLAYQVGATQFHGHDTGMFAFYLATDPSQAALAEGELLRQVEQLAAGGIPGEAFERVRATVLSAVALDLQSPATLARHAAIDQLFGLPATHHAELAGIFAAIAPDEVRAAARRLLGSREPTIIRVLPESHLDSGLGSPPSSPHG